MTKKDEDSVKVSKMFQKSKLKSEYPLVREEWRGCYQSRNLSRLFMLKPEYNTERTKNGKHCKIEFVKAQQ